MSPSLHSQTLHSCRSSRPLLAGLAIVAAMAAALLPGCASPGRGPYEPLAESQRNPLEAQRLTLEAADIIDTDPRRAESLLRSALTADIYHGPAHNNLGILHLRQGKLYEAANEFEWARKLMPGHPDPRLNLALTLEHAGRYTEAIEGYRAALEARPDYIPAQQALARLQLRRGLDDEQTAALLKEIGLRGETARWREWAQEALVRRSR